MNRNTLSETIRRAIKMESESSLSYKQVALLSKNQKAYEMFMQFSRDEDKHRRMLEYLLEEFNSRSDELSFPEMRLPPEYAANDPSPIYSLKLIKLSDEPDPVVETIWKFAKGENKAIAFYYGLADSVEEAKGKTFFFYLGQWEELHLEVLERQALAFGNDSGG